MNNNIAALGETIRRLIAALGETIRRLIAALGEKTRSPGRKNSLAFHGRG